MTVNNLSNNFLGIRKRLIAGQQRNIVLKKHPKSVLMLFSSLELYFQLDLPFHFLQRKRDSGGLSMTASVLLKLMLE
jgi:hypothetical protein